MNCDILKIVSGNDFSTQMTITALDAAGNVIENFSLEDSTDVVVKYTLAGESHTIEAYDYDIEGNDITIQWSDLTLGKYGFEIDGKFNGYSWRSAARFIFQIVADNASANIPDGVLVNGVYVLNDWLRLLSGGGGIKQVQADWDETDTNSPAYIQNKPDLNEKQDVLVSGENIKTINGESILGEGNIEVGGAVESVNGKTGVVVLGAEDVGAASAEDLQDVADDVETLQAAYEGLTQSDIVIGALPSSGVANTIYRVPSTSSYSDYMWNGSQFVLMATYSNMSGDGVYDISAEHSGASYDNLTAALGSSGANVPTALRKGGMSVKYIENVYADYVVVVTEGLTEQPTGTALQSAPSITDGVYKASQLTDFSNLPIYIGLDEVYYIPVTEDGITTYTTWTITKQSDDGSKYVQYRYLRATYENTTAGNAEFVKEINWEDASADELKEILDVEEKQEYIKKEYKSATYSTYISLDAPLPIGTYKVVLKSASNIGYNRIEVSLYNASAQKSNKVTLTASIFTPQVVTLTTTAETTRLHIYQSGGSGSIPCTAIIYVGDGIVYSSRLNNMDEHISAADEVTNLINIQDVVRNYSYKSNTGQTNFADYSGVILKANKTYKFFIKSVGNVGYTSFEVALSTISSTSFYVKWTSTSSADLQNGTTFYLTPPVDITKIYTYQSGGNANIPISLDVYLGERESVAFENINQKIELNASNIDCDKYAAKALAYKVNSSNFGIMTAGQSNALGRAAFNTLPSAYDLPYSQCQFFKGNEFVEYDTSCLPANSTWGFDTVVYKHLSDILTNFYVIKHAESGASIDKDGVAGTETGGHWTADYEYISASHRIICTDANKVIAAKESISENVLIRAILWHQGEGDYYPQVSWKYYDNLKKVIAFLRGLSGNPKCPFFMGTISHYSSQFSKDVEDAQIRIAAEDSNVYLVDMAKATLFDSLHFDAQSAVYFGKAVFNLMIDAGIINATKLDNPEPWE